MDLREIIQKKRLFFDGGSGSFLQSRGLKAGELTEEWNITHPEDVITMAESYYRAGANIVNANTFGANSLKFPGRVEEIVGAAVRNAAAGRERARASMGLTGDLALPGDALGDDRYIALDIGPTGKLLKPLGDLDFDDAVALFGEVVRAGVSAGADLVLIETMGDTYECKAAILAAKEESDLPVFVTGTFDAQGKLLTGGTVEAFTAIAEGLGADAAGINCSLGPAQMLSSVSRFLEAASVPVIVSPNAGLPRVEDGSTVYDVGPEEFAGAMEQIARMGAHILGGCCGTTPDHISALTGRCADLPFTAPVRKRKTVVSSFSRTVEIGEQPVIIGERINPTGKKKFQEALRKGDLDYILSQGIEQEDSGAHILDVNVGIPDIDEPSVMLRVMTALQEVTPLPLQIDTSDPAALETALRHYNGKAMVNSVNGKEESIREVFPIVKKYGGVLVGLTLDEKGIPGTSKERLEIARRIYEAADEYGIDRKDIVIDGLAMTVSSDPASALTTLETVQRVRREFGGRTVLGVSNISFGLPRREIINSAFLTMALREGLSCAIMNPNSEAMMRAYLAYRALSDLDTHFEDYIKCYSGTSADASETKAGASRGGSGGAVISENAEGMSLADCITRGLTSRAAAAAEKELLTREALAIVEEDLIPALDSVGKGFESGSLFLPQLLMAAEAAQAAFTVIRGKMQENTAPAKGKVILATVKNDIHDIGKNIVKVMLENYGYEVIDLGKDVPPEVIADRAAADGIKLVGLSALMTTTVVSMEDTIKILREVSPDTKVVVGGAVLTPEYADMIGADAYARDAMEMVRYADSVLSSQ